MRYRFSLAIKLGILLLISFVLILGFNFWQQYDVYRKQTINNINHMTQSSETLEIWIQHLLEYEGITVFNVYGGYQEEFINLYATEAPMASYAMVTSYNALLSSRGEIAYETTVKVDRTDTYTSQPIGNLRVLDALVSNDGMLNYFYVNTSELNEAQTKDFFEALKDLSKTDSISVSGQKEDISLLPEQMGYGDNTVTSITPSYLQIGETVIVDGEKDTLYTGTFDHYEDEEKLLFPVTHHLDYYPDPDMGPGAVSRFRTELPPSTWVGVHEYSIPKAKEAVHDIVAQYSSPKEYPSTLQEYTVDGDTYFYRFDSFFDTQTMQKGYTFDAYVYQDLNANIATQLLSEYSEQYFIAIGLVVLITFIILFIVIRPLKKIEKTAKQIANNDFTSSLKVRSHDELGSLANSINEMSRKLKATMENLETEIERVKKLEHIRKEFIARFTHEIKTPIAIIDGYNELLESNVSDKHRKEYLQIIDRETSKINDLVISMLALSKLESDKATLSYQEVDLEDLVIDVIDNHSLLLEQRNIKVHLNTKEQVVTVDSEKIETVIINFLTNAIKHTPRNGNIYITIDDTTFSIENEGSMIQTEIMESIWEAFQTHDLHGTGLGLSIARAILDLHKFKYGAENTDRGVRFYFIFK